MTNIQLIQSRQWALWCILFITLFKGNYCSNSTQTGKVETSVNETVKNETLVTPGSISQSIEKISENTTEISTNYSESATAGLKINSIVANKSELIQIFHETVLNSTNTTPEITVNDPIITNCANVNCEEQLWNETAKTNYTLMAEAVGAALEEEASFWLQKSVAVGAGIFLVSAVLGYFSCVGYRRFLQRKYGNSQILVAEEVYDTTDLRYFEI